RQQSDEDSDCGGLPRAVRPEEPEHLAPVHLEADAVHGPRAVRIDLHQVADLDQGAHRSTGSIPCSTAFTTARAKRSFGSVMVSSPRKRSRNERAKQAPRTACAAWSTEIPSATRPDRCSRRRYSP